MWPEIVASFPRGDLPDMATLDAAIGAPWQVAPLAQPAQGQPASSSGSGATTSTSASATSSSREGQPSNLFSVLFLKIFYNCSCI